MKSRGKRFAFRLTAWFKAFVGTLYNAARSASIITLWLRIVKIMDSSGLSYFTTRSYRYSERLGASVPPLANGFDQGACSGWPCLAGGGATGVNMHILSTPMHPH